MRRPRVFTIGQPPIAVPAVSATPHDELHPRRRRELVQLAAGDEQERDDADGLLRVVGAVEERERARHRPLAGAHRARARGGSHGAPPRRAPRSTTRPARNPTTGAIVRTTATPITPTGTMPSKPPQLTAPVPPSTIAAPTSPPSSACPELDGRPRAHVMQFHTTAPVSAAPSTGITSLLGTVTMPSIVFATALPKQERADDVGHGGEQQPPGRAGPRASRPAWRSRWRRRGHRW